MAKKKLNYWEKRALENEEKAQRYANIAAQRQARLYHNAYQEITQLIDQLAKELLEDGNYGKLSRSQLWQYKKFIDLQALISTRFEGMSAQQITIATEALRTAFEQTMKATLDEFAPAENIAYSILNKEQVNQVLNTAWSGKHYSQRIYGTNSKIAERIKKELTDMIVLGKNTQDIKARIMKDFNVSYSYADRLIRTEANHIYNEAAKKSYERAGVREVEVIVETGCCDKCADIKGTYLLGNAPRLPVHPNCRCCYAPVVNLGEKKE